jgi:hypothetical protein
MLFIDAVIANQDRHLNNWDIDINTGLMIPVIDFGVSCLSWETRTLKKISDSKGISPYTAKPFAKTHLEQLRVIKLFIDKKTNSPLKIVDSFKALEKSLEESFSISEIEPIYYTAVKKYLYRRCERILEISKDFINIV